MESVSNKNIGLFIPPWRKSATFAINSSLVLSVLLLLLELLKWFWMKLPWNVWWNNLKINSYNWRYKYKRPDWTFIDKFLKIATEKENKDLDERTIALVNCNLLIKKSSNGKDCFSLNPEMILDTCETAGNTISTNSGLTDINTS